MKKKGSKKKVSSKKIRYNKVESNRERKGFFFRLFGINRVAPIVLAFVFLVLAILLPIFTTGKAINVSVSGMAGIDSGPKLNAIPNALNSIFNFLQVCQTPGDCFLKEVIVYIIVLAIIFVMIFDILQLVSIFEPWVSGVIAGGMAIVAALIGVVRAIVTWLITIGAVMGIAAGFLEIGVSIIIFIGLIFAGPRISQFAARRKAGKVLIAGIKGGAEATTAVTEFRKMGRELARKKPK